MFENGCRRVAVFLALAFLGLPSAGIGASKKAPQPPPVTGIDVLTQRYDTDRTGHNPRETFLTPQNVNRQTFGKLFDLEVEGQIYAQPLIVSGVTIGGKSRNVVLVATQRNNLYLFDADTGEKLWSRNFGFPVLTPNAVWNGGGYYQDITPEVGILSTPVIDRETKTIYFIDFQWDPRTPITTAAHWLYAVDLIDLSEKFGGPVLIQGQVTPLLGPVHGGHASMMPSPQPLEFDPSQHLQRPSLLLDHGRIVAGFGSHADQQPYQGWVFSYDARDLTKAPLIWNSVAGGAPETWDQAGIWQSGTGFTSDGEGGFYLATGNGEFHAAFHHYADSVVRLSAKTGALEAADYFTPCNQRSLSSQDLDLGSGGVLRIPGTKFLVAGGKGGMIYLLDKDNLGKYQPPADSFSDDCINRNIPQQFEGGCQLQDEPAKPTSTPCTSQIASYSLHHIHGTPVIWGSATHGRVLYVWRENDVLRGFQFNEQTQRFDVPPCTPPGSDWNVGKQPSPATLHQGMTGGMLTISSNQGKNGILWAVTPINNDANQKVVPGILRAYDADDLRKELWTSFEVRDRDDFGNFAKFTPPIIANGKVYLPTFSNHLSVYGLNPAPPKPRSANLIQNGSFEDGTAHWTASSPDPQFQVNHRYPYLNESQGVLCPTDDLDVKLEQAVVLPQTGTYRLTAYAGTNILPANVISSSRFGAVLVGVEVAGNPPVTRQAPVTTVSGYQRYTVTFDAPAGATATVWFYVPKVQTIPNFGNQPDCFMMLDGIELSQVSGP